MGHCSDWALGSGWDLEKVTGMTGEEDVKLQQQMRRKGEKEEANPVIQNLQVLQVFRMLPLDQEALEIHIVQSGQEEMRWETNPTGRE